MPQKVESKVTPEVLQTIYLDEIASRLADLQATMESINNKKKKIIPTSTIRHVPYHARRTLNADAPIRDELIKDDISIGLGTVGRTGYIYNEGPGSIEIKIYDGDYWTGWKTIATNHGIDISFDDNIWMEIIKVKADKTTGATYELTINPGLEEEV